MLRPSTTTTKDGLNPMMLVPHQDSAEDQQDCLYSPWEVWTNPQSQDLVVV